MSSERAHHTDPARGTFAIDARGVGKRYHARFRNMVDGRRFEIAPSLDAGGTDEFWALRDVSFSVAHGETVGILGRNGAGKSTLLRILAEISPPSEGTVRMCGRVGALLEVGAGFSPDLSGRDNVRLVGTILGMDQRQISRRFDEIVEFAGVGAFIDLPVKRYSSGMYLRLAFSVAAHLDADILLIDEALAVGDQDFRERCLNKLRDLAAGGHTVLFVSHDVSSVARLCRRALVIDSGRVVFDGEVAEAVAIYGDRAASTSGPFRSEARPDGPSIVAGGVRRPRGADNRSGQPLEITADVHVPAGIEGSLEVVVELVGSDLWPVTGAHTTLRSPTAGVHRLRCSLSSVRMVGGSYRCSVSLRNGGADVQKVASIGTFEIDRVSDDPSRTWRYIEDSHWDVCHTSEDGPR